MGRGLTETRTEFTAARIQKLSGWCWVLTAEGPAARASSRPQAVLVLDCDATQPFARLLTFVCRLLTRHLQVPSLCCTCTLSPSLHANLGPCTSWAAPRYPFTFGSHFFLSSQLKNENPKEPRTRIWPCSPLSGWGVCAGDITGQPWPSVRGSVSREGLSHGSECAAQLGLDPLRSGRWVWWAPGLAGLLRGGRKHVYNRRLFSFCLPESRKPSRRMCWGHPNNHEHSAIIQKWNGDLCKDLDQSGLLPVEGLCIQLGLTVFTKGISFASSHACLLTLRSARADVPTWLRFLRRPTRTPVEGTLVMLFMLWRGLFANGPLKAPSTDYYRDGAGVIYSLSSSIHFHNVGALCSVTSSNRTVVCVGGAMHGAHCHTGTGASRSSC